MFQRPYNIPLLLFFAVLNLWLWEEYGHTGSAVLSGLLAIYVIAETCAFLKENTHGKI